MQVAPSSIRIQVNGLSYAAQRWENVSGQQGENEFTHGKKVRKVLCLHGWLDNSESFARLAPQLKDCDVVAIDMAGHGKTSHRAAHASYDIYDDLEDIGDIADELGWDQFTLLGHSRGAGIAFLYASVMPERVKSLVLLDGIVPPPWLNKNVVEQLRAYILDRQRLRAKGSRPYATLDEAIERRLQSTKLTVDEGRAMIERDLIKTDDGFVWSHDNRLHGNSAVRFSSAELDVFLSFLKLPTLLLAALDGQLKKHALPENLTKNACIELYWHAGKHHFHMERAQVAGVAQKINHWWAGVPSVDAQLSC
ncbi:MAG: alpha/beta hydrolase [Pseudomonadales bacterium]|nr:alpha/beta hydrolase [Pseudomonadales bacterium]